MKLAYLYNRWDSGKGALVARRVQWRIKQLRREMAARLGRDVQLSEVYQKTGIAVPTLSNIENNKTKGVEFQTLEKLAEFYDVEGIGELLSIDDQRRRPTVAGA